MMAVITGTVFDGNHHPVPAMKVFLRERAKVVAVAANAKGIYVFSVRGGEYSLRLDGETAVVTLRVAPGGKATRDLTLQPAFFDEPTFTVAGVTDNTYRGGHGSDTVLRSAEDLAKATASLADRPEKSPLEAVREYEQAAKSQPTETNLFHWATELLSHGAPREAAAIFAKGVERYPQSARMLLGSATSYYALGDYGKAADCYFRATDLAPQDPAPYEFLAKAQAAEITHSGGYEDRMARFAALQPANAFAIYSYAVARWNRQEDARALFEKAAAIDPHFAKAYLALGMLDAQEGRPLDAITQYKKALAEDRKLLEAHFRLAEAYRITGDLAGAKAETAIFDELTKQAALETEQERAKRQRFVIAQ